MNFTDQAIKIANVFGGHLRLSHTVESLHPDRKYCATLENVFIDNSGSQGSTVGWGDSVESACRALLKGVSGCVLARADGYYGKDNQGHNIKKSFLVVTPET